MKSLLRLKFLWLCVLYLCILTRIFNFIFVLSDEIAMQAVKAAAATIGSLSDKGLQYSIVCHLCLHVTLKYQYNKNTIRLERGNICFHVLCLENLLYFQPFHNLKVIVFLLCLSMYQPSNHLLISQSIESVNQSTHLVYCTSLHTAKNYTLFNTTQ